MAMAEHANWGALIAGGVMAAAVACGSNAGGSGPSRDGGSSNGTPGGGDNGGSDSSAAFGDDAGTLSVDAFAGCATDTEQAKQLPLDLYLMIDSSGSMNDLIGPQRSKWNAVADAMTAF